MSSNLSNGGLVGVSANDFEHDGKGQGASRGISDVGSMSERNDSELDLDSSLAGWTETTDVPQREMGSLQVASLMINQMIGYGIFANPGFVLVQTGSKRLSIAYWTIGGLFQLLCSPMFLEYAIALPFTGGPLIWLDETFHQPRMLAAFIFSWFWIVCSYSGNCLGVSQFILALIWPDRPFNDYEDGWLRFVAVVVITVVCLLLYFLRRVVFVCNSAFAVLKIVFLVVLVISGVAYACKHRQTSGLHDFDTTQPHTGGISSVSAFLSVTYSYQGWEHTNYIAGEIRRPERSLKFGVYTTLTLVTVLYVLVVVAFYTAIPYDVIAKPGIRAQAGIAFILYERVFGTTTGMDVISALSSFSCILAYAYTDSKIKQAMAWQRILPFSGFFGKQDRQFNSAGGALFLHWLTTTITVGALPYFGKSAKFWFYMFDYGYYVEIAALAIGLYFLRKRMDNRDERWKPRFFTRQSIIPLYIAVVVGFCGLVLVVTAIPDYAGLVPNHFLPVALAIIVAAAIVHWSVLRTLGIRLRDGTSIGRKIGFEVRVYSNDADEEHTPEGFTQLMKEARADGSHRRIDYELSGFPKTLVAGATQACRVVVKWLE